MDALNLSSSLSIKCGTIKAGGSASYVNEDKVNNSDINYIVTVKVTNETSISPVEPVFQPIEGLDPNEFTSVYGDCFISGFLEGGEFSAIISVKINSDDKSKKVHIGNTLEAAFGATPVSLQEDASFDKTKSDVWKDTETTISVNWSGGGEIKKPEAGWDPASVASVANAFANNVAKCPSYTSAVLTKYMSLRSFNTVQAQQKIKFKVLNYDCCGLYASELFEAYMKYKDYWKQLSQMMKIPDQYKSRAINKDLKDPIQTDVQSLNMARLECRKMLALITKENDLLRTNPERADFNTDGKLLEPPYTCPQVFGARLPVKIRGDYAQGDISLTEEERQLRELYHMKESIFLTPLVGDPPSSSIPTEVFCSIKNKQLHKTGKLTHLSVHGAPQNHFEWMTHLLPSHVHHDYRRAIAGLGFRFSSDGKEAKARDDNCTMHIGKPNYELAEQFDISQSHGGVTKVVIEWVPDSGCISGLTLSDTFSGIANPLWTYKQYDAKNPAPVGIKFRSESFTAQKGWSLLGFWGSHHDIVTRLGVVWGKGDEDN